MRSLSGSEEFNLPTYMYILQFSCSVQSFPIVDRPNEREFESQSSNERRFNRLRLNTLFRRPKIGE